jgi:DNA replication protein DnaC
MRSSKKTVQLDADRTRAHLEQLGLGYAADRLPDLLSEAVKGDFPSHRFLDVLLEEEVREREERRIRTSLRLSGMTAGQTLGSFDFGFQPAVERNRIETLATCQWIRARETLLLQGPPGVEKTHRRSRSG